MFKGDWATFEVHLSFSFSEFLATESNEKFWKFIDLVDNAHTFEKPSGKCILAMFI